MNSELLRVVEREARAEADRLLAEARGQSEGILAQAGEQARAIRQEFLQRSQAEERTAEARARSAANLEASAMLLEAKSRVIESLFAEAAGVMDKLPPEKRRLALKGLMAEAAAGLSGRLRIEVSPRDEAPARKLAGELKLDAEVVPDARVSDGAVASTMDGSARVYNRINDRLQQARPLLTSSIARMLWG